MRRLTFALAGVALGLLGFQFSAIAGVTPTSQRLLQNSPLAAYPGFGHNVTADEARFDRESLAREKLTASCMQQQGFAYTVVPPVRIDAANPGPEIALAQNPNVAYAESLSDERRVAYYMALYGVANPNSPAADDLFDRKAPGGGGCSGQAFAAIPSVYAAQSELNEEYLDLRRSIKQEPRVVAAERKWSACMQRSGHRYASSEELLAELDNAVAANKLTPALQQRHEQAIAVARSCGQQSGLDTTIAQVRVEKETAFVAEHQALLKSHVERLNQAEALLDQVLGAN
jgi:hypothetical protein